ncbi:MAG: [protein-PII] uridylyltransferase [Zoogloeaceae bacterium]|jgi:[protein-PII] uridylyltransferase|nr:[protein-PII] uridylyltransferase [Zoogloeaceae bacterium]
MNADDLALTGTLREALRTKRKALADEYVATPNAALYLAEHACLVDGVLARLWAYMDFPPELTLAAVGGFGRGELYPGSDVDLLILLPAEADAALQEKLARLVSLFWDIGLEVGHSVRTIAECLKATAGDITIQTALLESRHLIGNAALHQDFQARFADQLDPQAFLIAKRLEQEERHQRYQDTPYSLEPDCKESPGGLRDLQNILWVAKAGGYGANWRELKARRLLSRDGHVQLRQCENTLQNLRIRLHLLTGRREDKLLFDHQEALASVMGVVSPDARRPSEVLMQSYYRTAKRVTQLNAILLQNIAAELIPAVDVPPPRPLNARFRILGEFLDLTHAKVFEEHPSALLESFLLLQAHPELRGMSARTLRALWRGRVLITPDFRRNPENRRLFLRLFQGGQGVVHAFRRMNQYDILGNYLPAFGKIVGQMQHDLFHAYTVDQHILQVLRNLRRFAVEEFAHEYPYCSRLHNAFARPWTLYVAALFHDIAKGRGGDHSLLGMEDARAFCAGHYVDAEDAELIVWLVGAHLYMSQVAQKEDIADPEVVAAFAGKVGNARRLTALYLLTVADIRGTSPKVWNNWKAKLLEDLYRLTLRYLETGTPQEPQGVIQERQAEAMSLLRYFALSDTVHERLWKQFDTVYFLRHTAEEIAWHTRALHYRIDIDKPVVKARVHPGGGLQVMAYAGDRPDLFLRMAAFFARAGYSIAEAKLHTTRHGYALDSFILLDVAGNASDRDMIAFIETELAARLAEGVPAEAPAQGRLSRQVRHFPVTPEIHIHPDERGDQQALSLIAVDRPGLLYHIAVVLARHNIAINAARISTLGERVEDTFLISGPALNKRAPRLKLEQDLLAALSL